MFAAHAGVVSFAGTDTPGPGAADGVTDWRTVNPIGTAGAYVTVSGADGRTRYMHLDTIGVRSGQRVAAGDQLGTVGNSGASHANAHLHFELWLGGVTVDPDAELYDTPAGPELPPRAASRPTAPPHLPAPQRAPTAPPVAVAPSYVRRRPDAGAGELAAGVALLFGLGFAWSRFAS